MRTIVAQWSKDLKIPENESFTLYYRSPDKILIDDIEKLKNVTLIKYDEDKWLSSHFFDIYKDACENGRLKGDSQLFIVTNEAYEGLQLPSQVIIRKSFPQNDVKNGAPAIAGAPKLCLKSERSHRDQPISTISLMTGSRRPHSAMISSPGQV